MSAQGHALLLLALAGAARAEERRTFTINEYRVEGARQLSAIEVETAVYPFLGTGRVLEDVEKARAALEKTYSDKGYQSVAVAIPPQTVRDGVVVLKVTEGKVGRLRVRGSRWFSLSDIKELAPSMAEGAVPNFNDVVRDIYVLNQLPDRRVTPALRSGVVPGTIDVDLNVQDRLPLHGSLEFNNRYSANTTPSRLNGSIRYDNLWQAGHSIGFSFQLAPQRNQDGKVFSGSYLARFAEAPWLTLSFNGVVQNSDISTLGTSAVIGRGQIFGGRASFTLPGSSSFFHSLSAGVDYKHFGKEIADDPFATPIAYWPFSLQYGASWSGESSITQGGATVFLNLRDLSSDADAFDAKRYRSSGSFIYARGDLSRSDDLPLGFQLFERVQGQTASGPLLPAEQITAGGVESVRGYLEAAAAGDSGAVGTIEVRGPAIFGESRLHAFFEGGRLALRNPLPEQRWVFFLWSTGGGARFKLFDYLRGSLDVGVPLRSEGTTTRYHPRLQFRAWAEF